jgi:AAA domain
MFCPTFDSRPMDQLEISAKAPATAWLWQGSIARGSITLLTGQWKTGKTTLMTGFLQRLGDCQPFLGRRCESAKVLVASQESHDRWRERLRAMPVGPHAELLAQPFRGRPTPESWNRLIEYAGSMRESGDLDLFVVDSLSSVMARRSENDPVALLELLQPLQRLTSAGVAVLFLHRLNTRPANDESAARGGDALLGIVDIVLELRRVGRQPSDRRRRLIARSHHFDAPRDLYYQWDPATGKFRTVTDPHEVRFRDNWRHVQAILCKRTTPATHRELLMDWPGERKKPSVVLLYRCLNRAADEQLVERTVSGTRDRPYRYWLSEGECDGRLRMA